MPAANQKILIIAEKPSVAGDIARALGELKRVGKDYFEGEQYVVSSAVGHLLEIIPPDGVEVKRGKWSLANLPVLPEFFALRPIKASESRLKVLEKLYRRKDVSSLINACDAGREGELIFHHVIRYLTENGQKAKPVQRLWLQSMTSAAIRRGFEQLRKNEDVIPLRAAAVCRAEADWLVGINSTRALTALNSGGGGFFLTTVGRVQTPTLAIIVEREREIENFVVQKYWEVQADFAVAAGVYTGLWTAAKGDKPQRISSAEAAKKIVADCNGKTGIATETVKPASEAPPLLFDLTSLQREANARFGMSARGVLATAQSLYERYKLITYPRTDSRALPEDYPAVVRKTLSAMSKSPTLGAFAARVLNENWVVPANKRIFNNAKVSDHFAIVPTGEMPKDSLRDNEKKLYDLISRRFIAIFYPPAKFLVTERWTIVETHRFLTKGRVLKVAGWREVAAQLTKDTDTAPLAGDKESTQVKEIAETEKETSPPPRYNEATLLSAMEGAGKRVEDEELREAMRERGLGTPATRAAIIEGLVRENYIVRDRRDLIPMPKARSLMRLLAALKVDTLTLPSLTGEWEYKLRQIEAAKMDSRGFMDDIRGLTSSIVQAAKDCGDVEKLGGDDFPVLSVPCPVCGGKVRESHRRFGCVSEECDFFIWKAMGGREFSAAEATTLLKEGEVGELDGFRSRRGHEFSAKVRLQKDEKDNWRAAFDFDKPDSDLSQIDAQALADSNHVGACPKCAAPVREQESRYVCENSIGEKPACEFTFSRVILKQEIKPEQIQKLLDKGKTDVLEGFISKKTNRPFKARLTMDLAAKDGKLIFEFPPAAGKKKKVGARAGGKRA